MVIWKRTLLLYVRYLLPKEHSLIVPGFVAFSTIGYGDLTPVTPTGRSVFIVWALLGVGAMTILISGGCKHI